MIGAHFLSTLAGTVDGCIVLRNKQGELSQQGKMKMTLPNSPYFQPLGAGKESNQLNILSRKCMKCYISRTHNSNRISLIKWIWKVLVPSKVAA